MLWSFVRFFKYIFLLTRTLIESSSQQNVQLKYFSIFHFLEEKLLECNLLGPLLFNPPPPSSLAFLLSSLFQPRPNHRQSFHLFWTESVTDFLIQRHPLKIFRALAFHPFSASLVSFFQQFSIHLYVLFFSTYSSLLSLFVPFFSTYSSSASSSSSFQLIHSYLPSLFVLFFSTYLSYSASLSSQFIHSYSASLSSTFQLIQSYSGSSCSSFQLIQDFKGIAVH